MSENESKKAFTLIELIIVMAILAILAVIAIPQFGRIRQNAARSTDMSSGKTITNAILTLLGEDDLELPENKASIILDGISSNDDADGMTGDDLIENTIVEYLQGVPKPRLSQYRNSKFLIEVTSDGKIVIRITSNVSEIVYPVQEPSKGSLYYPLE